MKAKTRVDKDADETIRSINSKTGRNMPQAVGTAVVLVVLIVACLLISPVLFMLLVVIFMILGLWELRVDFAVRNIHIPLVTLWICSTVTLVAVYFSTHHVVAMGLCIVVSLLAAVIMGSRRIRTSDRTDRVSSDKRVDDGAAVERHSRLTQAAVSAFTVLYIPLLASCIVMPLTFNGHPVAHAVMIVFMPALGDTGGLFAGAWLGRHKLCPSISPKKSVEGLCGSILFAVAGVYAVFACTYDAATWATRWWFPLVAGVMIGVVGTFGDLCASLIKRNLGIKDMGHMLKGHGGVLDRVDSILLTAPFLCVALWLAGL